MQSFKAAGTGPTVGLFLTFTVQRKPVFGFIKDLLFMIFCRYWMHVCCIIPK